MSARRVWRAWAHAPFPSSRGLLLRAALLAIAYLVLSVAGVREYTAALSFSSPAGVPPTVAAVGCAAYLVFHFAWVLVVPVLLIAAALLALVDRSER